MKVHGNGPVSRIKEILDASSTGRTRPSAPEKSSQGGDTIELSGTAREFHAIREAALKDPEVRASLVEGLRRRIDAGEYTPNARIIATKLLEDLGAVSGK
jgi:flagellar biosynthesis anti-sigma factor FlgM